MHDYGARRGASQMAAANGAREKDSGVGEVLRAQFARRFALA